MAKKDSYYINSINPRTHPMFTYDKIGTNKYLFMRLLANDEELEFVNHVY